VAVDLSQPHLKKAREREKGLEADFKLVKADLEKNIPLEEESFDLVWFGDVICPSDIENPSNLVTDMKEYLKYGGFLSIFYGNWLRQSFMPGYARLEQKINAAYELMHETRNLQRSWQGPDHPEKALNWLKEGGYRERSQEIFLLLTLTQECLNMLRNMLNMSSRTITLRQSSKKVRKYL
jgi:Methyltransferase domain.